jgi:nucleotide-binding universal stress UspA family protein
MIKKILLGLGGTPYTSIAIQRAVELAKRFETEITGVPVVDVKGATKEMAAQRVRVTKEKIEEAIGEFESSCAAGGIKEALVLRVHYLFLRRFFKFRYSSVGT